MLVFQKDRHVFTVVLLAVDKRKVCQNGRKKRPLDANAWLSWCFFAARRVEPAGILWKLR